MSQREQRKGVNDENEKSSLIRSDLNFEGSLRVRDNRYRRSTEYNESESQPLAPLRLTRTHSRGVSPHIRVLPVVRSTVKAYSCLLQ